MTLTNSELTFSSTPTTLVFGIATLIATGGIGFMIWKRSAYSAASGWLEVLRFLIVAAVALT